MMPQLVYRISKENYAFSLSASGYANRWNKQGEFVIYASSSRSLATLEMVVHRKTIKIETPYKVMVIELDIPGTLIKKLKPDDLPVNWRSLLSYKRLQAMGSEWYSYREHLVLQVPSAVITQEYNYMINTKHDLFSRSVSIKEVEPYVFDRRIF